MVTKSNEMHIILDFIVREISLDGTVASLSDIHSFGLNINSVQVFFSIFSFDYI